MRPRYFYFDFLSFLGLYSFADALCSGKNSCQFHVAEILMKDLKPCPPELSSFLEESHSCVQSKFTHKLIFNTFVNLQSFADTLCSGKPSCQYRATEIMRNNIQPCPLELSSYLSASYVCLTRNFFTKWIPLVQLCRRYVLREGFLPIPYCWDLDEKHKALPSRIILLLWREPHLHSKYSNHVLLSFVSFVQSFADGRCSGRQFCQFRVTDIMHNNIKPCPLELSSYFEASHMCLASMLSS